MAKTENRVTRLLRHLFGSPNFIAGALFCVACMLCTIVLRLLWEDHLEKISAGAALLAAILGVAMSLKDSWPKRHPWLVIGTFAFIGSVGFWAALKQGDRSNIASRELADALRNLNTSAIESARINALNSDLQRQLIKDNDELKALAQGTLTEARQAVREITGLGALVIATPINFSARGDRFFVEFAVHTASSAYTGIDVNLTVIPRSIDGVRSVEKQLGDVAPGGLRDGGEFEIFKDRDNRFELLFQSRSVWTAEVVVMWWDGSQWLHSVTLNDMKTGKQIGSFGHARK